MNLILIKNDYDKYKVEDKNHEMVAFYENALTLALRINKYLKKLFWLYFLE
jgi:hypothetical protein